ncbi:hypothetical protein [uncultured Treponema sp.]|uniref:InlB B-repeat-containing protein n=1 Tax=uncultured Treponema sp. TaxID=162155 RepID=UPI0025DAD1AB|nr:hypothetical protein [uncultured Treponema sp.]
MKKLSKLAAVLASIALAFGVVSCKNDDEDYPTYTVTVTASENGSVTASKTSGLASGEMVTLTITAETSDSFDCTLSELSVKNGGTDIEVSGTGNERTFTMPAANVSVSATFIKTTYIGSKKPSKAKAVGDIVFSDGSATPYTDNLTLTGDQKAKAVAVIFYVGTDVNDESYISLMHSWIGDYETVRTLGVGLAQSSDSLEWCTSSANAYNTNIKAIKCTPESTDDPDTITFSYYKNGSTNFSKIGSYLFFPIDPESGTGSTGVINVKADDTADEAKYPAFHFAKNYANQEGSHVSGTSYAEGWYIPSIAELYELFKVEATVTPAINLCGGSIFPQETYWSSSQCTDIDNPEIYAWGFYNGYNGGTKRVSKNSSKNVRVIHQF